MFLYKVYEGIQLDMTQSLTKVIISEHSILLTGLTGYNKYDIKLMFLKVKIGQVSFMSLNVLTSDFRMIIQNNFCQPS